MTRLDLKYHLVFNVAINTLKIKYEEPKKNIWKDADMMMKYLNN